MWDGGGPSSGWVEQGDAISKSARLGASSCAERRSFVDEIQGKVALSPMAEALLAVVTPKLMTGNARYGTDVRLGPA